MFNLPQLPFKDTDLEPYVSANTIAYHYTKHHQAYVTNLNGLIENTPFAGKSLEEIIMMSKGDAAHTGVFNNAAQVWNHTFYWNCLQNKGQEPSQKMQDMFIRDFGSVDAFKVQFKQAALTQFGSGWAWLVLDEGHLKIMKTSNADLPMAHGKTAILTCDVWEHAYYLDYQNKRAEYVDIFMNHLINWEFVESFL